MIASSGGSAGAAYSSRSGSYATVVASHRLARQRSMPAALAAAFASCGRGGERPRRLGDGRGRAPASLAAAGGGVVRALLAWVWRGRRRKAAVMARSGSSSAKEQQYGHDEYAQNFDEGAAAGEPENLSRSFSARYARRALRWDGAR
ncbi:hypothetical protein SEVIR_1G039100v4 [Setaria viridis]|uniref:Uncharacterized protein n=1 Tax=Setaria viridis TaxID=4556 RepID=A0A4U6WH81_SETVI|nr:uncharacterized protein LOC117866910 [Setaria viridis]TKW37317.1 hypothetical protein SEVIR_1G039100v2 [Setaria viridis]